LFNVYQGFNHKREFIAAQGPLDCTIDDFWRMIWEQQVPIVVMLTKEKEKEKVIINMFYIMLRD
jgi:protein tyrosine phosphatase